MPADSHRHDHLLDVVAHCDRCSRELTERQIALDKRNGADLPSRAKAIGSSGGSLDT